jgi:hypothetical protein
MFFSFMHDMGVSQISAHKIWLIFFMTLAGLSMRYFVRTISTAEKNTTVFMSLVSASFYMINFYAVNVKTVLLNINGLYATLPLMLAFIYRIMVLRKKIYRYILLGAVTSVLYVAGAVNPPAFGIFVIIQLLFICFLAVTAREPYRVIWRTLICIFLMYMLTVLLNVWWIMPLFKLMFHYKGYAVYQHVYWNPGGWLRDTFVLGGCWAWGDYYYPVLFKAYQNIFIRYALYVIPTVAFAALLFPGKNRRIICFFAALSFIGIFLAKGRNGIFGMVYVCLFENFPGFWMFREPYSKFGNLTVLGYSVLIGMSIGKLLQRVTNGGSMQRAGIVCASLIIIGAAGWPIGTRYFVDQVAGGYRSVNVKVPEYWKSFASFINGQKGDFRLFEMPENMSAYTSLKWEQGFSGGVGEQCLFDKPTLTSCYLTVPIIQYFYYMFREYSCGVAHKMFRLLNVKYLYQRNDIAWEYLRVLSPQKVTALLRETMKMSPAKTFGMIDVYRAADGNDDVYLKDAPDVVVGGFRTLPLLSYTHMLDRPSVAFWGQVPQRKIIDMCAYGKNIVLYEEDADEWIMKLLPDDGRVELETLLGWKNHNFDAGWCVRNNFYFGEWVRDAERKYVNGDFFGNDGAIYTAGTQPFSFVRNVRAGGMYWIGTSIYVSPQGGLVSVTVDGEKFDFDASTHGTPHLKWFFVRKRLEEGKHEVMIASQGSQVLVDACVFYTDHDKDVAIEKAKKLSKDKNLITFIDLRADNPANNFRVLHAGSYDISLCAYGTGMPEKESIVITIDDAQVQVRPGKEQFGESQRLYLREGMHQIRPSKETKGLLLRAVRSGHGMTNNHKNVTFKRYGPSRLVIDSFSIKEPMMLVFNETYHEGWKAYNMAKPQRFYAGIASFMNVLTKRHVRGTIDRHDMVNGYANAFYLPEKGVYTILLEFEPQNSFDVGMLIALITAAGACGVYILMKILRGRV